MSDRPSSHKKYVSTRWGDIAYLEAGDAERPPVLFVHGIPTSGYLWRHVIRLLRNDLHAYAPDLMGLGDTRVDPASGRFDMASQAEMLVDFMAALGHERFGLVCHDQGGAAAQLIAAHQPERVAAFVITNSVCYDNWPVPVITWLQRFSRLPVLPDLLGRTGIAEWIERSTPLSSFRRGVFRRDRLEDASIREYLRPVRGTRAERQRFRRFVLAGHPRHTEAAVRGLRAFDKPTLVLWGGDDRYLSPSWGKRLQEEIPGAERFELIPFCGHFWQEERPAEFAAHIGAFLTAHLAPAAEAPAEEAAAPPPSDVVPAEALAKPKRSRSRRSRKAPAAAGA